MAISPVFIYSVLHIYSVQQFIMKSQVINIPATKPSHGSMHVVKFYNIIILCISQPCQYNWILQFNLNLAHLDNKSSRFILQLTQEYYAIRITKNIFNILS